jgi:hypothetical protein
MATLQDQNQQQQGAGVAGTIAGTSAPSSSGGQSAGNGTNAPVSNVMQNAAPQNAAGFTDVSAYLNANQQGGQQLGQQVAGNITNAYNATKGGIDTSAQNTQKQISAGYIPENTQLIQQVSANPTAAASNKDTLSAFQGQLNDVYGGPTSWADLGNQQANIATAQQNADISRPGMANVMAQTVEQQLNPGQTSAGINALDTLLLTGNPGAVQAVQQAASPYNDLNAYLNSQNAGIGQQVTGAQDSAQRAAANALAAGTGGVNTLNTNITGATQKALTDAQARQASIKADIANLYGGQAAGTTGTTLGVYGGGTTPWYNTQNYNVGQLAPEDLAAMGMTQDQWNALQGSMQQAGTTGTVNSNFAGSPHHFAATRPTSQYDIGQYLNQIDPTQAINAGNVATPEQYAQMNAWNQLLGSKAPTQTEAINPALASLAGTYNPNSLNQFDYNAALQGSQGLTAAQQKAAQDEANALESNANLAHAESQHHGGLFGYVPSSVKQGLQLANPVSYFGNEAVLNQGNKLIPK